MGTMRFLLPSGLTPEAAQELEKSCVVGGPDNMPWPTQVDVDVNYLSVRRDVDESGNLVAPWTVDGAGQLMNATSTLIERDDPYFFQLELARGKLNQVRCQTADWRTGGLQMSPELSEQISQATQAFGQAVTALPSADANQEARAALVKSYQTAQKLVQAYVEQVFQVRHQRQHRLETVFGCRLHPRRLEQPECQALGSICNSVCLPFPWKEIEPQEGSYNWEGQDAVLNGMAELGVQIQAGPLIDFAAPHLPDWLWLWERDLASLAGFMCEYVETTIRRYKDRINCWQLTAASNSADVLGLGEEEILWLTARLAESARHVDPGLELIIGLSQPWGEYMALHERNHSPIIFADTLIRAGLNLAAVDIEVIMGVAPRGSYCRDLLDMSRLLDMYALLGVPLQVTLGYPSARGEDPRADVDQSVTAGYWRDGFNPATQADWAEAYAALAVSKPFIRGVHWAHLTDSRPHCWPHCGLIDAAGQPKPAMQRLAQLREKHLR
jgi:hypothetical protein